MGKKVIIDEDEYDTLIRLKKILQYLLYFNLENWKGYQEAIRMYNEDEENGDGTV